MTKSTSAFLILDSKPIKAIVRCYSGYKAAEKPRSVIIQGTEHLITKIEKHWRDPSSDFFQVLTDNSIRLLLSHNRYKHSWSVFYVNSTQKRRKLNG